MCHLVASQTLSQHKRLTDQLMCCIKKSDNALRSNYPIVSICHCCSNKLSQTQWNKATQIYYLTVLRDRHLKLISRSKVEVSAGLHAFFRLQGRTLPSLAQRLEAACILQLMALSLISTSVLTFLLSLILHLLCPSSKNSCDYTVPTQILHYERCDLITVTVLSTT